MKRFYCILTLLILLCCFATLTACNNGVSPNTCTVTFIIVLDGEKTDRYTTTVNIGDTIDLSSFNNILPATNTTIGHYNYTGPFWDEACFHKHDDDLAITSNATFYIKKTNEGVPIINFMLDGKSYALAVDKTQPINVFDFITCAYGKASVPSQFEFYKDENMTDKIELVDFSYKECDLSFWNSYTIYVKNHQIASVKFCLHDINGCATSFNTHILTDELLTTELFQNLYREYYNDKTFTLSKAVFYSDKNLTNQIYYATNETQNTIHVDYSIVSNE